MSRPALIALAGVVALVASFLLSLWTLHREEQPAPPVAASAPPPAKQSPAAGPAEAVRPAFDIVRINPQGETVIAGRAMPRAEVQILDGGKEIGRVIADNRGEWVFVPDLPLSPGSRELTLKAQNPDGSAAGTQAPVVLVVPDREKAKGGTLAVKVNPDGTVEILQGPPAAAGAGSTAIGAVQMDAQGRLAVSGTALPHAWIQLYLDEHPLGRVQADDQGRWRLARKQALAGGGHRLRADALGADGKVAGRAEITVAPLAPAPPPLAPAEAASPAANETGDGRITVESGANLWRIARGAYGSGIDYMMIYQANKDQIRDPNRIYPGQVFTLPTGR